MGILPRFTADRIIPDTDDPGLGLPRPQGDWDGTRNDQSAQDEKQEN